MSLYALYCKLTSKANMDKVNNITKKCPQKCPQICIFDLYLFAHYGRS